MLPRELSECHASLLPGKPRKTLSLCFDFANAKEITNISWQLTETQTNTSYTYDQADADDSKHMNALRNIAEFLGSCDSSHDWVAKLMIFYNTQAGLLLARNGTGIFRRHKAKGDSLESLQGLQSLQGIPEFLKYEAAEYCLETSHHFGLGIENYAYASSPLRRYADLVNQRAIKKILTGQTIHKQPAESLVKELNRREKQAKAFSRDMFFMSCLAVAHYVKTKITGIVMSQTETPKTIKTSIWVPEWRRIIKSKGNQPLTPGSKVAISWYEQPEQPRWKEKIVFKLEEVQ
jgi:hypothetical protein